MLSITYITVIIEITSDSRYNSCSANEESWSDPGDNMEFIYSPYNLGSLVVAKLEGYPW